MTDSMVAIITGANRGIGRAIVESLAKSYFKSLTIYATSRKGYDLKIQTASGIDIKYAELDIADSASVDKFADEIRKTHSAVDVLINNAAAHDAGNYVPKTVKKVIDTNFGGTLRMCQAFIPILHKKSRIVNISSVGSSLTNYSKQIQQRFRDPNMTLQSLEEMLLEYEESVNQGSESQKGWPKSAYSVSKASVNALTAVLARDHRELSINCCCPGWVDTDMGSIAGSRPPKSPEDGAKIPIRLGFKDIGGVSGRYWSNLSVASSGEGQVMDW